MWNCIISGHKRFLTPDQVELFWKRDMIAAMRRAAPEFIVDERNRGIMSELYAWTWGYNACKLDLYKGILLYGPIGTGKTTLMRGMQNYFADINRMQCNLAATKKLCLEIRSASEIALNYSMRGLEAINRWVERGVAGHLCIDEIGREEDAKFYGTPCNVIRTILQMRYEQRSEILTFGTTNMDMSGNCEEFRDRYGDYILDRIKEMFNIVPVDGNSRRG